MKMVRTSFDVLSELFARDLDLVDLGYIRALKD